jgi:hypothetical protein
MQSYILILLGVVVAGIAGLAYYTYTSSQGLSTRIDSCDQEINQLKVKLQGMESIFAKPPIEDLAPMFDLTQHPRPFDITPQWTKIIPPEANFQADLRDYPQANFSEPLVHDVTEEKSPKIINEPLFKASKKDPWTSSASESDDSSRNSRRSSRSSSKE